MNHYLHFPARGRKLLGQGFKIPSALGHYYLHFLARGRKFGTGDFQQNHHLLLFTFPRKGTETFSN